MSKVVVTGIGLVTPIGTGIDEFWPNVLAGKDGFSEIESFDSSKHRTHRGAEIKNFTFDGKGGPEYCRSTQFALTAARQALADAGLPKSSLDPGRTGVAMGTTSGEPNLIEHFNDLDLGQQLPDLGDSFTRNYPCNHIPGYVASELGVYGGGGPVMLPVACAAGNCAIGHAYDLIRTGEADVMLAGGADAFSRITYTGFCGLFAVAPEKCQPFDKNRKGMMPGEGAGVLVLERLDSAQKRGAQIYAEVAGYGLSCDAFHMTGSDKESRGAVRAMEKACAQSGINPEQVDYISAHGTGTKSNDYHETNAAKKVFGEHARKTPMSSIKSMFGHTMGAASAIEAGACALAISRGAIPPTMNFETPDPDCDLDYVPNEARELDVSIAMNNAYAFGGTNASLILRKCAN
ncbi:MAG: 3-oxoacyl-[acyl-carrier-protein] synthase II [Verrucomicrobiales bacterium]|jgi:3-oxoacyl-[acyl-carrier-protein] synthase II